MYAMFKKVNGGVQLAQSIHRASFPNLPTLELHRHVVGLEFVSVVNLERSGVVLLRWIRELTDPSTAFVLFSFVPGVRRLMVRGRT